MNKTFKMIVQGTNCEITIPFERVPVPSDDGSEKLEIKIQNGSNVWVKQYDDSIPIKGAKSRSDIYAELSEFIWSELLNPNHHSELTIIFVEGKTRQRINVTEFLSLFRDLFEVLLKANLRVEFNNPFTKK